MSASTRKILADMYRRKARTLLLISGILVGVFGLISITFTKDILFSAFAYTIESQATQPDITMVVDRLDAGLLPALKAVPNVKAVQFETRVSTLWSIHQAPGYTALKIISYPDLHTPALAPFELISGRYPQAGEIVLEYGDTALAPTAIGDMVRIDTTHGQVQLRVVGMARTAGVDPATSGKAQAYMSADGIRQLDVLTNSNQPNRPARQYMLHYKVEHISQVDMTARDLQTILHSQHISVLVTAFPGPAIVPLSQINGIFTLLIALVILAVLVSAILIFNTVTTLITEQTAIIATMKTLGGTQWQIMRSYLLFIIICSSLATIPGLILGITGGYALASILAPAIPLALGPFILPINLILLGLLVGFGVPILAAILPLWNGTRITIREALSTYGVSTERDNTLLTRFDWRLTWISQTVWMGLRSLFRKRWRAMLTIFMLSIAGTSFLMVQILTTSINYTVGSVFTNFHADIEVDLGPQMTFSSLKHDLARVQHIRVLERYGQGGVTTRWGHLALWGIEPQTRIYHYQLVSGRWLRPEDREVVLISRHFSALTGLAVGDNLSVTNPSNQAINWRIIGIINENVNGLGQMGAAVVPVNTLYQFQGAPAQSVNDAAFRVLLQATDHSATTIQALTQQLGNLAMDATTRGSVERGGGIVNVYLVQDEIMRHQRSWFISYILLYGVATIVGGAAMIGLANELTAAVLERRREIGMLRTLGASSWRVAQVFWVQGLSLGLIAWLPATLLGLPLAYAFLRLFSQFVMPVDFIVDPLAFLLLLLSLLTIATLASIIPLKNAARLHIAELLRYE
ncbi:hypothetical protein KDW_49060 [Dictyobacter vulcani]|uniref:ABC3 transporter permease protein domain-containing protein n=1 Tax=Dictyobacter vulcani TaxID=2607529 RepID=A0A5J4KN39_9CHLR|nr:ABC transporter permease [Dictyobacter vulcani]GER90744.1 hypothetical protein KDW_49060 [Dictyobacter vulcani]